LGTIQASNQRLTKFRQSNPRVKAPSSVFESAIDDVASLYSVDSAASSTDFSFDNLVINSQAYRRALNQTRSSLHLEALKEQSETSSETETVVDIKMDGITHTDSIPESIRNKLTANQLYVLLNSMDEIIKQKSEEKAEERTKELLKPHDELREKYQKIKRYYFDMLEQKQKEASEREMLAAEYSRVVAEKAEIEHEKNFMYEQIQRLNSFFSENEEKRKLLVESHEKELRLKDNKIAEVELSYLNEKEDSKGLRATGAQKDVEISKLTDELDSMSAQQIEAVGHLQAAKLELIHASEMKKDLEDELQRYKGFDSKLSGRLKL
jgi:chromosome segregation ATPase